jgi:hypothetical protein
VIPAIAFPPTRVEGANALHNYFARTVT